MLSVFILLVSLPVYAHAYSNNSNNIYEYSDVSITSDLIIEESFSESEDNIVLYYLLNECRAKINKQDIVVKIQNVEHRVYDIIIPPPDN